MDAFFSFGNFYVDIISIAIVVIVLIAMIKGIKDGFLKTLLNLAKAVIVFFVGILLAKPVGELIANTGLGTKMSDSISSWLTSQGEIFSAVVTADNKEEVLAQGFASINIPEVLQTPLANLVGKYLGTTDGQTLGVYLAQAITHYSFLCIGYLAVTIVCCILLAILSKIIRGVQKTLGLVGIDRALGMLLSIVITYLIIDGLMFGLTFLNLSDLGIADWLNKTMYLTEEYSNVFTISKFIYTHSIVKHIIALFIQ